MAGDPTPRQEKLDLAHGLTAVLLLREPADDQPPSTSAVVDRADQFEPRRPEGVSPAAWSAMGTETRAAVAEAMKDA